MSKATTTIVMLLMAIAALACGNDHQLGQPISPPYPSASELAKSTYQQWHRNPAYYEINHLGNPATFHGKVADLTPSHAWFGAYFTLSMPTSFIRCEFDTKQELATLRRGNKVTVSGTLGPFKGRHPTWNSADSCRTQNHSRPPTRRQPSPSRQPISAISPSGLPPTTALE